jgi:hypothetical protein
MRLEAWLNDHADDTVLRWLFAAVLAGTVTVLALDYAEIAGRIRTQAPGRPSVLTTPAQPLPSVRREHDAPAGPADGRLAAAMSFDLVGDGRLLAVGTIEPGTARRFAEEIGKRGSYVKTVVLRSPGGSVRDALEMGRLIRERKMGTEVEAGRYCASSCPLVFAGGVERRAGEKAAIGVHQVFAMTGDRAAANGMQDAQRVSAECQRYLREMGVDPQVWVHAMETPKERLYYFTPDELLALKLATDPKARSQAAVQ